jgi:hypothetical protein
MCVNVCVCACNSRETPFCPHLLVKRRAAILAIVSSVTLLVITTTTLVLVSALGAKGPGSKLFKHYLMYVAILRHVRQFFQDTRFNSLYMIRLYLQHVRKY